MKKFWLSKATLTGTLLALASSFLFGASALAVPPGHSVGSDTAPVFMEVWVDYADQANVELDNSLSKVLDNYGSSVQLVVKPFPVSGSSNDRSYLAAEAGECVAAQAEDLFWSFHKFMLGRYGDFTTDDIWQWAQGFQVYTTKPKPAPRFNFDVFANCWKSGQMQGIVGFYVAQGYLKEVETTPTTLVISRMSNEVQRFEGATDYEVLSAAVDYFLSAKVPPSIKAEQE